jgi:NarL family two-component system response regulator LiaR
MEHSIEIYVGAIAAIFTGLGIWLALKLSRPKIKTVVVEKEVYIQKDSDFAVNEKELSKLNLSKRELEVLQLMADGLSNQEIASRLYLSLNTIKTHSLRLFEKMDVARRTQAIDKAKKLGIIP